MRVLLILAAALTCGCGVSISYGKPDPPPRSSKPEEACYHRARLAPATAEGRIEWRDSSSPYRDLVDGVVFYRDGRRLGIPEVVASLGDDELTQAYRHRLHSLAKARRRHAWLLALGVAIAAVGATTSTWAIRSSAEGLTITGTLLIAGGGTGMTIYERARWRQWRATHQAYERMFIDRTLTDRLSYQLERHDRAIANDCGYKVVSIPNP